MSINFNSYENIHKRICSASKERNIEIIYKILDDTENLIFDSFVQQFKSNTLSDDESVVLGKCIQFIEYYRLHLGKSQRLIFVIQNLIEGDIRFNLISLRLKFIEMPLEQIHNIVNDWQRCLKNIISEIEGLDNLQRSKCLPFEFNELFSKRVVVKVFRDIKLMLDKVNVSNEFIPYIMNECRIENAELLRNVLLISTINSNSDEIIDFC